MYVARAELRGRFFTYLFLTLHFLEFNHLLALSHLSPLNNSVFALRLGRLLCDQLMVVVLLQGTLDRFTFNCVELFGLQRLFLLFGRGIVRDTSSILNTIDEQWRLMHG